MLKSMTGYGKAEGELKGKNIIVEVKSLNSKQLDASIKLPTFLKEKEIEIRNEIIRVLERGKIDLNIRIDSEENGKVSSINSSAVKSYYGQLSEQCRELGIETDSTIMLSIVMRLPDAVKTEQEEIEEDFWNEALELIRKALDEAEKFRINEGKALEKDILVHLCLIKSLLDQIGTYEKQRLDTIKTRIQQSLNELMKTEQYDKNRFEQELIYYLEKIDVTEEKVRLANHCKYFEETINLNESTGRKLGFIAQEMGREINTIGSKASNSDIQKLVVQMKDELEKIKEQLLNIL